MATTKKGIYYPDDYSAMADIPADMKKMAESLQNIFDTGGLDKVEGTMIFRGSWIAGYTYQKGDVVYESNQFFVAISENDSRYPSEQAEYWKPLSDGASVPAGRNDRTSFSKKI